MVCGVCVCERERERDKSGEGETERNTYLTWDSSYLKGY